MTEIIPYKDKDITEDKYSDYAYKIRSGIIERKVRMEQTCVELGGMFKTVRDHKLYQYLDCDTFEEFLADPEIGFKRSTVYSFMHIYDKFVEQLKIDVSLLSRIGHRNLQIISTVAEDDPEHWIAQAEQLSGSDLINEVRAYKGKAPLKPKRKDDAEPEAKSYAEYVEQTPCIVCGKKSEKAHFPITRKAGASDDWVIPLCRKCHSEYHNIGVLTWFDKYRRNFAEYLYGKIIPMIWRKG